jgi:hypothetical protein
MMACASRSANSGDSRTDVRAGTWPAAAQPSEFRVIHSKKTAAARRLSSSGRWFMTTRWWEPPHTAGSSPITGRGATPQSRSGSSEKAPTFQMPPQWKAFWPFWKAVSSPSWPMSTGLWPSRISDSIQSIAVIPSSESQTARVPSSLNSDPPNWWRREWKT